MKNLIFLHGWAAGGRIWEKQQLALGNRARLWAPDLPVWDAAWLLAKLHSFDPRETILVGWSLGGMLALEICAAGFRPQALVTIAACASFCRRPDFALGVSPTVLRAMRQRLQTAPAEVVEDFYRRLLAPGERQWEDTLRTLLPQGVDAPLLSRGLEYLRARDLREGLSRVEADSVVILQGERDGITAAAQGFFLQEYLPGARLVMLAGTGHVPMVSRHRELNELLADLL